MRSIISLILTIMLSISTVPLKTINVIMNNNIEVSASKEYEPLIAGGYDFSIARLSDGTFWAWGANEQGQLGLGDYENRLHPVKLDTTLENENVKDLIVVDDTVIAHLENGDFYTWGKNVNGVGGGNKPTKRGSGSRVKADSVGYTWYPRGSPNRHDSFAFVINGKVYVSGSGFQGQYGRGINGHGANENNNTGYIRNINSARTVLTKATIENYPNSIYKRAISGTDLDNVKLVQGSINSLSFVAVTNNNEIYTWGSGYPLLATLNSNNKISGNIVDIEFGNRMYALTDENEVWEWTGSQGVPSKINIPNAIEVSSYGSTVMILDEEGNVHARGSNSYGEIGEGNSSSFSNIASNIKTMSIGHRHSLFITNNNEIYGMGWNAYRQLGDTEDGTLERFEKIDTISNVDHIFSSVDSSYAAKGAEIYGWGRQSGDFGSTTNNPRLGRTFDSNIRDLRGSLASEHRFVSVVTDKDELYNIGNTWHNGLGRGGAGDRFAKISHSDRASAYIPNTINGSTYVLPLPEIDLNNTKVKDGIQGSFSGAAIDIKGNLLTWGHSTSGQWGDGGTHRWSWGAEGVGAKSTGAFVKANTDVKFKSTSGGQNTRIALSTDGSVYSFGANSGDSLGRSGDSTVPRRVDNLSNISAIDMGRNTGLALDTNGNIYSWGNNGLGQVGNGSVGNVSTPSSITNDINDKFRYIHSGIDSMFAVNDRGELYSWGNNRYGQLGLGDRFNRTSPRKVSEFPHPVKQVASGGEHTLILLENGDVYVAGADGYGQLGRNTPNNSLSYRSIPFPDYVTLETNDNQELDLDGNLKLVGNVTSVVPGSNLVVKYSIDNPNGQVESGIIKRFKSDRTPTNFDYNVHLDSKYSLGGYSATVTVEDEDSGINNSSSINFGLLDTIPPTSPKINVGNSSWTSDNVIVSIIPGVDHGSGVDSTEYRINNDEWKVYSNPFEVSREGESKIEARTFDRSGNISVSAYGATRIDKTAPEITITPNTDKHTHEDVILNVVVKDKYTDVKSITYNGKTYNGKPIRVKRNSSHTIEATDSLDNKSKKTYSVSNIDKSISFMKPTLSGFGDISLDETVKEANLSPLIVNDWRDDSNSWRVTVSADRLNRENEVLNSGLMTLRVKDVGGQQSSPKNNMYSRVSIDGFVRDLASSNISRGRYEVNFDDLEIKVDPTQMKVGKYKSTITWSLTHAP